MQMHRQTGKSLNKSLRFFSLKTQLAGCVQEVLVAGSLKQVKRNTKPASQMPPCHGKCVALHRGDFLERNTIPFLDYESTFTATITGFRIKSQGYSGSLEQLEE